MKVFTYGFDKLQMEDIRWRFGKEEYIYVTFRYQDIMELNADMIIVSLEFGKEEEISSIREYENETNDIEGKTYVYVTEDMQMEWTKDMYYKFYDALEKAASVMTVE